MGSLTLGQEEDVKRRLKAMEIGGRPHCLKTVFQAVVLGAFSVACLLLGHQIAEMGKQPAEKHLEAIFALRRARILRFCQKEKNLSHPPSPPLFLHHIEDLPGDLIFCVPKKAGSVSLYKFFAKNAEYNDYMSWHNRTTLPPPGRLLASTRMMVIRHPLHRLASAFQYISRYSVEDVEEKYFEHTAGVFLSEEIIQHLRPNSSDPQVSFSEFVTFILDEKKSG